MLTLYYSPGACSMAAHILLEESGEPYEARRVNFADSEQRSDAYLKLNPQGKVPLLLLDDGEPVTENTAILPLLGQRFGFWPKEAVAQARLQSLIGFLTATAHPAFTHINRPERFAADPAAHEIVRETGRQSFDNYLNQIDGRLAGREWISEKYSAVDPYLLVFYGWGNRRGYPMADLSHFTAFKDRMLQRPAVQRVVEQEKVKL
jgi:glutathione S-transferase